MAALIAALQDAFARGDTDYTLDNRQLEALDGNANAYAEDVQRLIGENPLAFVRDTLSAYGDQVQCVVLRLLVRYLCTTNGYGDVCRMIPRENGDDVDVYTRQLLDTIMHALQRVAATPEAISSLEILAWLGHILDARPVVYARVLACACHTPRYAMLLLAACNDRHNRFSDMWETCVSHMALWYAEPLSVRSMPEFFVAMCRKSIKTFNVLMVSDIFRRDALIACMRRANHARINQLLRDYHTMHAYHALPIDRVTAVSARWYAYAVACIQAPRKRRRTDEAGVPCKRARR